MIVSLQPEMSDLSVTQEFESVGGLHRFIKDTWPESLIGIALRGDARELAGLVHKNEETLQRYHCDPFATPDQLFFALFRLTGTSSELKNAITQEWPETGVQHQPVAETPNWMSIHGTEYRLPH